MSAPYIADHKLSRRLRALANGLMTEEAAIQLWRDILNLGPVIASDLQWQAFHHSPQFLVQPAKLEDGPESPEQRLCRLLRGVRDGHTAYARDAYGALATWPTSPYKLDGYFCEADTTKQQVVIYGPLDWIEADAT